MKDDESDCETFPLRTVQRSQRGSGALVALFADTSRSGSVAQSGDLSAPVEPVRDQTQGGAFVAQIPLALLKASPHQAREDFAALEDLSQSIAKRGVLQPILVRALGGGYEIIAGERRSRAAAMAGLETVPALILNMTDRESAEVALIENAQREDLNPIEEAFGFQKLSQVFGMNQSQIGEVIGKSRAHVANSLRLLQLPEEIREMLRAGVLSAGHARAILSIEDTKLQIRLARRAAERAMSVRMLEELTKRILEPPRKKKRIGVDEPALERTRVKVSELLGVEAVRLRIDAEGKRTLNVVFESDASWRRFMSKIR